MADLTTGAKALATAVYPVKSSFSSSLFTRTEQMLTPEMLKTRYFKGVSLSFKNGDSFSSDDLKDKIILGINNAELLLDLSIVPEGKKERLPFDGALYRSMIHTKVSSGPVISVQSLEIEDSRGTSIFQVPADWIDNGNFHRKQINVIPLLAGFGSSIGNFPGSTTGMLYLSLISQLGFVASFWSVSYVSGISTVEGNLPVVVNDLIGVLTAIEIFNDLARDNTSSSQSQSVDGVSQSSSGPSTRVYDKRLEELHAKKEELVKKIKGVFSNKFYISNI